MNLLKLIVQSLKDLNYLTGDCFMKNGKIHCQSFLLKNGLKIREQLLKQWIDMHFTWAIQLGNIHQIEQNLIEKRTSFLQSQVFKKSYEKMYKEKLVNSSNSIALKAVYNNVVQYFVSEEDLFYGSDTKTVLVTDFFVSPKNELSKYYNLQRERKIWWMRFSANPSRYWVEPFDLCLEVEPHDEICKNSKSITIKANFPFGVVDMESISLVPLYKFSSLKLPFIEDSNKISLIRSVINLNLTTSALILDASLGRTETRNNILMLNRKLAPYQVLLANLHEGNKTVDELTIHLQNVISKSSLRVYDSVIRTNSYKELEKKLMQFDSLGIPYSLVVNEESIKSGLIQMRSRDTTLSETIHISDIPTYLLNIFKN